MSFADDDISFEIQQDAGPGAFSFHEGKATAEVVAKKDASIEETNFKALLKLTGRGTGDDRPGVDVVAVLDVSGSMGTEDKIGKLKIAAQFLIRKLSPIDRLSIVIFSTNAKRLCRLRQVTVDSQSELLDLVQNLAPESLTNIKEGLETALQVLKDRRISDGRVGAIMLMSDGEENVGGRAAEVPLGNVPVHTFGFGTGHDAEVLNAIAKNSREGTFALADVDNSTASSSLSEAFSQCLAGLLTVSVQDLKVTIQPFNKIVNGQDITPKIEDVSAGNYPQSGPDNDGSFTVSFGNLYIKEKRKVLVNLLLPPLRKPMTTRVLTITHSYKSGSVIINSAPIVVSVTRTPDAGDEQLDEILVEEKRLETVNMMKDATDMADRKNLYRARKKLVDAHFMLGDVVLQDPTFQQIIDMMKWDVQQYKRYMKTQEMYESLGRAFGLSAMTSHARQRFAARGDPNKQRQFSTPVMEEYRNQAIIFNENPSLLPTTADYCRLLPTTADSCRLLPTTADKNVKQEIAADSRVTPFAGGLVFYLEQILRSLQTLQERIHHQHL